MNASGTPPLFTKDVFAPYYELDAEGATLLVGKLLRFFLEKCDLVQRGLSAAQANGDLKLFQAILHRYKSMTANVGALALNEKIKELEKQSQQGGFSLDPSIVRELDQLLSQTKVLLEEHLRSLV